MIFWGGSAGPDALPVDGAVPAWGRAGAAWQPGPGACQELGL